MDTKYLKKIGLYLLSSSLAIALIIYLVYHMVNGFTTDLTTVAAEIQSKKSVISANGYIFKNEHYLYSDYGGTVGYLVGDGEKVSVGHPVARAFSESSGNSLNSQLTDIENKLEILSESELPNGLAKKDTASVDKKINSNYHSILQNISEEKYSHAMQSTDLLLINMNRRQIIIGERDNFHAVSSSLEAQKASLTSKLQGTSEIVYSDEGGYFFTDIDGYEEAFSISAVEKMNVAAFYELIESSPKNVETVDGKHPVGKISTGYKWYIALPITKNEANIITTGKTYVGVFPYNYDTNLSLKAEKILVEASGDRAVAVFSCGEMPSDFSYLRSQSVEIVISESRGYRVPKSAVRFLDGFQGVYTLYGSTVEFKRIDILLEVEGHYIVNVKDPSPPVILSVSENSQKGNEEEKEDEKYWPPYGYLSLHDRIIVSGKGLEHGMVFY